MQIKGYRIIVPIKSTISGEIYDKFAPKIEPIAIDGKAKKAKLKLILLSSFLLIPIIISSTSLPITLKKLNKVLCATAEDGENRKKIRIIGKRAEVPPTPPRVAIIMLSAIINRPETKKYIKGELNRLGYCS